MRSEFTVDFNKEKYPSYYITKKEDAEQLISSLCKKEGIIAGDLETYVAPEWREQYPRGALSPILGRPRLFQIFTGKGCAVIDLLKTGPVDLTKLFKARQFVFHNASFDLKFLMQHFGLKEYNIECTLLMARMLFHAISATDLQANLGAVVKFVFGEQINKKAGASDWSKELTYEQVYYAAQDTIVLYELYHKLVEKITALKLTNVYKIQRQAQYVICKMELKGIRLDPKLHRNNISRWRLECQDAEEEVKRITNIPAVTSPKVADWLTSNLSEDDLQFWPRTDKDNLKTDADTFLAHDHLEIVKPFSKYQKAKTLSSNFGTKLINLINPVTGRIHPSYNMGGARTGRLSCSEPNLQNQPRSDDVRSVYIADPGYVIIDIDYASIEPRIVTELSQDEVLLEGYRNGVDLYKLVASQVLGVPLDKVTKDHRQWGKVCVLSLNYLGGKRTFIKQASKFGLHISEGEAVQFIEKYRDAFPGLRKWQLEQVDKVASRRYTVASKTGKLCKYTEEKYYTASANFPVQALAAECMQLALIYVDRVLEGTGAYLIANVHDEVLIECPEKDAPTVGPAAAKEMERAYRALLGDCVTADGIATATWGKNWAEAKKD